jgi:hypothetical protein
MMPPESRKRWGRTLQRWIMRRLRPALTVNLGVLEELAESGHSLVLICHPEHLPALWPHLRLGQALDRIWWPSPKTPEWAVEFSDWDSLRMVSTGDVRSHAGVWIWFPWNPEAPEVEVLHAWCLDAPIPIFPVWTQSGTQTEQGRPIWWRRRVIAVEDRAATGPGSQEEIRRTIEERLLKLRRGVERL